MTLLHFFNVRKIIGLTLSLSHIPS